VKPGDIILRLTDLQNDKTSLRVGHSNFEGIITSAYVDISSANYKSKYLYYLLHAYDLMKVFYNLGAGLRQGMKFSDLKRLPAFGVEQDEQQQIIDYLESYERKTDELKQKIQTQITLLRERRTSLISHAVTGKVKIT
jgi:type I restriction enzyme S subunit